MATNRDLSGTRKTLSIPSSWQSQQRGTTDGIDVGRSNYPSEDAKEDAIEDDKEDEKYEYGDQPSQNFVAWLEKGVFNSGFFPLASGLISIHNLKRRNIA